MRPARPTTSSGTSTRSSCEVTRVFAIDTGDLDFADRTSDEIRDALWEKILQSYTEKEQLVGREVLERVERDIMLQIVDSQWKDHLYSLDHLKEGIGLRGYGQRDPLIEYKKESFELFQAMKDRVDEEIVRYLWWLRPVMSDEGAAPVPRRPAPAPRAADSQRSVGGIEVDPEQRAARAGGRAGQPVRAVATAPAAAARRRRRCGGEDGAPRRAEGRPQRPLPVRQREKIQEVSRDSRVKTTESPSLALHRHRPRHRPDLRRHPARAAPLPTSCRPRWTSRPS